MKRMALAPVDGRAQMVRVNFEGQIAPIELQCGDAGILHGGRGGMPDGMPEDGAKARAGID